MTATPADPITVGTGHGTSTLAAGRASKRDDNRSGALVRAVQQLAHRVTRRLARCILGRPRTGERGERGSAAIEAVIGVTAFGLFVAMIVAGGRIALARQAVESAANDAARAASIARTSGEASSAARTAADGSLRDQDVKCTTTSVAVDTGGFAAPIGTTAQVGATVSCTVNLSDLAIPGMPGSRTITETVTSPIDAYRERR